jgi:hypothetical protein
MEKINQKKSNLDIKFKGIDIIINDNKKLIKLFSDNYLQFLNRIKGTDIDSKNDLIKVLNRKPSSFLKRLNLKVREFQLYDKQLTINKKINKIHPKKILLITKQGSKALNQSLSLIPINNNVKSSLVLKEKTSYSYPTILNSKINQLNKSLNNNDSSIPLNLLNPLLKTNNNLISDSKYKSDKNFTLKNSSSLINKLVLKQQYKTIGKIKNEFILCRDSKGIFHLLNNHKELKTLNNLSILNLKNKIKQHYTPKINKFINLIKIYHQNNLNNLNITKYFQLITKYKTVNPFHQNINYNINKINNKKFLNISVLLEYAFRAMSCLISKPVFLETHNKLIINLFYCFIPGKVNKFKRAKRLKLLKQSKLENLKSGKIATS